MSSTFESSPDELRGVLIQVVGARLLLPNACIAEILSVADPDPLPDMPDWLLGRIRWRGWQVPLIAFSALLGSGIPDGNLRSQRVLILKALGGNPRLPYFAMLTQGFPRLVRVEADALVAAGQEQSGVAGVPVIFQGEEVLIPNLEQTEARISEVLEQLPGS